MNYLHRWLCGSARWRRTVEQRMEWILSGAQLGDHALEVGSGPGITSDLLRSRVQRLTAIEADDRMAKALRLRLCGSNVEVVTGDAADMPFPDATFSGCAVLTMLHHVSSQALQNAVLREIRRVLRPGGELVGCDSLPSALMRMIHIGDTFVLVDPDTLPARLAAAGFEGIQVERASDFFRFHARCPREIADSPLADEPGQQQMNR
jgi:ubiquinone/menaquinone biosynthesis C-methylase UbiE